MRIELQENGIKVRGKDLHAGDIFCVNNPLEAYVRLSSMRLIDMILDNQQVDNFIYDTDWGYNEANLFLAFSVKDNDICLFPEDREYIQLSGKMVLERY